MGSERSEFGKFDSFTLEPSKNQLIRNFLRNGRLRVNAKLYLNLTANYELINAFHNEFENVKHSPLPLCCSLGEMYNLIEISDES